MFPRGKQFISGHHRPSGRIWFGVILSGCALIGAGALPALAEQGTKQSFANIEQISDVLARTRLAQTRLAQSGAGNQVNVVQDGKDLVVDAYVQGQMNRANDRANTITQAGDGAIAEVSVIGDENRFSISQNAADGPGDNKAYVTVKGDFNDSSVRQTNDFGPTFGNTASLVQTGNGNSSAIAQTVAPGTLAAAENFAAITQTGDDNSALIEQTGADNSAMIEQDGDENRGAILQDGEGLSAILIQTGTALEYTINQTGCVISSGCGAVSVTQSGP
ncbi:hypothetical protein [uncultured Hyphomonas sp.]|uniref:hypothetical protein n=1 Tax=uncultured Hyphomonas sp. TaxID=225298 RepID=UPI002AAB0247|nr:hypothetical protein [uncultured Hyphomonas sp.]